VPIGDAPTRELGTVEAINPTPWLVDPVEHVPELVFPTSVTTYARMRRDSSVKSVLNAYMLPILRAPWHVDPRGATDRAARIVADSLGLPVLGDEPVDGPIATRWVNWRDHLRMALRDLVYGFMPFEDVYDVTTGTAYLSALAERMPWGITSVNVDPAGRLAGITQPRPGQTDRTIPADRLLYYCHDREGANWYGNSLLREAFGPWLFKTDALRGQARTLRRFGTGVPVMEPTPGTNPTPAQMAEAQRMARSFRGDSEHAGAATPGFRLRVVGVEGTLPDHIPWLRYLDEQIARSTLTSVLDLGNTDNGSRALGQVFLDLLVQAMQTVAEDHANTASRIARRLTDFNEGTDAEAPLIVVGDVGSSRQTLATTVASLVTAGALTVDTALEAWVRDAFDLPPSTGTPAAPPAAPAPAPAPTDTATAPPVAAAGSPIRTGRATQAANWPYRRELTTVEAAAGVDPVPLDAAQQQLVDAFLMQWGEVVKDQVAAILDAVSGALDAGDLESLASFVPPYQGAADALAAAAAGGYEEGVRSAMTEAVKQRKTPRSPAAGAPVERYAATSRVAAASLASSLSTGAMREALRLAGPATPAEEVVTGVDAYLASLTGALPRDVAGGIVATGINDGRAAVMTATEEGEPGADPTTPGLAAARYYASEVRDANTCEACLAIDGHEFATLEEAEAAYPTGGYSACAGRLRCRGIIFATYGEDT
jgi:predicted protein tyrosine phosphatase